MKSRRAREGGGIARLIRGSPNILTQAAAQLESQEPGRRIKSAAKVTVSGSLALFCFFQKQERPKDWRRALVSGHNPWAACRCGCDPSNGTGASDHDSDPISIDFCRENVLTKMRLWAYGRGEPVGEHPRLPPFSLRKQPRACRWSDDGLDGTKLPTLNKTMTIHWLDVVK